MSPGQCNKTEKQRALVVLKREIRRKDDMKKLKLREQKIKQDEKLIVEQRAQIEKKLKELQLKQQTLHEQKKQLDIQKKENEKQNDVNVAKRKMLKDNETLIIMKYQAFSQMSSKSPAEKPKPTKKVRMVNAASQATKSPGEAVGVQTEPITSTTVVDQMENTRHYWHRIYPCFFCTAEFSREERLLRHCGYVHQGQYIQF